MIELPAHIYEAGERSPYRYDLAVKNETAAAVRFTDVKTSCGCTTAELEQTSLQPGETMKVPLKLDLRGRQGVQVLQVRLVPDGGPSWKYAIRIPAYPRAVFSERDVFLGRLPYGKVLTRKIELAVFARAADRLAKLEKVRCENPDVQVRVAEGEVERFAGGVYGGRYALTVAVNPREDSESREANLTAMMTGNGSLLQAESRVWWAPRLPVEASPSRVFFGGMRPNSEPVSKQVTLTAAEGAPVVVRSVESGHAAVEGRMSETAADRVLVRLDPRKIEGRYLWTQVSVEVERPVSTKLEIPVAAILGGEKGSSEPN